MDMLAIIPASNEIAWKWRFSWSRA